jgi:cytochrome c oxidase cbb3-type subunit 4
MSSLTYETVSTFVQQGGSVYFVLLFLGALAYALWPRNRETFDHAARMPLEEKETLDG